MDGTQTANFIENLWNGFRYEYTYPALAFIAFCTIAYIAYRYSKKDMTVSSEKQHITHAERADIISIRHHLDFDESDLYK